MSIMSDFEDRLAGAVEGLFAGAFRSPVQPAEVAKALGRAMDDGRTLGVSKVYAPTSYTVALSSEDREKLGDFAPTLAGELATFLVGHASEHGYDLVARPQVAFVVHADLKLGRFRVSAQMTSPPAENTHIPEPSLPEVSPTPAPRGFEALATVTVSDVQHDVALKGDRVDIGRLAESGIRLSDVNVSRAHATFVREGIGWAIQDLDSTNGTFLNGERVERESLKDGDKIQVGATELIYHEPKG